MSYTFDQTTLSKWNGISMSGSGCGCCALASIVYNLDKTITPYKTASYLYSIGAFSSAGTTRLGMTKAIKHYMNGYSVNYYTPEHLGASVWNNVVNRIKTLDANGKEFYVIWLVVSNSSGNLGTSYWTGGGHFVNSTSYRSSASYKDGEVYIRDSGARKRTGWHNINDLKYYANAVWIIVKDDEKKGYQGDFPTAYVVPGCTNKQNVIKVQMFLNWYNGNDDVHVDGIYIKADGQTGRAIKDFQKAEGLLDDGKVGKLTLAKMKAIVK